METIKSIRKLTLKKIKKCAKQESVRKSFKRGRKREKR